MQRSWWKFLSTQMQALLSRVNGDTYGAWQETVFDVNTTCWLHDTSVVDVSSVVPTVFVLRRGKKRVAPTKLTRFDEVLDI